MINEQVYGAKSAWLDCYYQQDALTTKNKKAFFEDAGVEASSMLFKGVQNNKLSYSEPIDKSLSYCGLGTESALSHISYIGTDPSDTSTVAIIHTQDRAITNFSFFEKNGGNVNPFPASINQIQLNSLNNLIWTESYSTTNISPYLAPYTQVNPKNMVLLINVYCRSIQGVSIATTLQSYIDNDYKNTYPQIIGVSVDAYIGNDIIGRSQSAGKGITNFQIPFIVGLLDTYEVNNSNVNIYAFGTNVIYGSQAYNSIYINYDVSGNYITPCYTTERGKQYIRCGNDGAYKYLYVAYYDGIIEDILSTVACFGLYFTGDVSTAQNGALTDTNMYIGLLDSDGIGHGEYLKGSETANAPQNDWDDMTDSGYDYTKEVDKTKYKNDTEFNLLYNASSVTTFYVLNDLQVNQLAQELYTILSNVPVDAAIEKYNQQVFLTNNAIDCIVSLKRFPLASVPSAGITEAVKLGTQTTSIQAARLQAPAKIYYFNFSSASDTSLYPHFNRSFLDYEPYTKAKINIPFCGSVEVPCTYLYNYGGVTVALAIDFITGGCTGYVICNGIVIDSVNGQCSVELPLSGIQSSTVDSQIFSASQQKIKQETSLGLGILAGAVAIGAGIATGGLAAVAGGALAIGTSAANYVQSERELDYELTHMQAPLKQVGAASGQISELYDTRCKMVITRPKINPEFENSPEAQEAYARTIGYACLLSGIVSDFTGFTVGSIDLDGVAATAEEKEMLKNYFASGVYL